MFRIKKPYYDKSDLKRNYWYMYTKNVVHDGMSESYYFSAFDLLYPLFIISGCYIFMVILRHWDDIKRKIKGN